MAKCTWVVVDSNKQEMRCNRCRESEPLSIIVSKRLDFAARIMKGFADAHKRCQETNKEQDNG